MRLTSKIVSRMRRAALAGLAAGLTLLAGAQTASAQEILLTGPLAGAPSVRKLKLYRDGRFEIAPTASFSLLDEYQREIYFGARLNYNLADWVALGVWGAAGAVKIDTALAQNIQTVNVERHCGQQRGPREGPTARRPTSAPRRRTSARTSRSSSARWTGSSRRK